MIIDEKLRFSNAQALTGTSAVVSANVIDLGADIDIGPGAQMWICVCAKVGLAGTSPTMTIKVQTDDNSGFSSATDLLTTQAFAAADMATGKRVVIPMPNTNERYLRLSYTMGGTSPTSTVDAFLTHLDPTAWVAAADAL